MAAADSLSEFPESEATLAGSHPLQDLCQGPPGTSEDDFGSLTWSAVVEN